MRSAQGSSVRRLAALLVVGAASLAACGGNGGFNDADVAFATGMIPHHQQAVEMAEVATTKAASPEVRALAERIAGTQEPEIQTMQGWLEDWDQPAAGGGGHEGHGSGATGGTGMMSDQDMAALERTSGPAFDRMFLQMMTVHHQGAVDMATDELDNGEDDEAQELAGQIREDQTREITEMRELGSRL